MSANNDYSSICTAKVLINSYIVTYNLKFNVVNIKCVSIVKGGALPEEVIDCSGVRQEVGGMSFIVLRIENGLF